MLPGAQASWSLLGWTEPISRLFWEVCCVFHPGASSAPLRTLPVAQLGIFLFLHVPNAGGVPRCSPAPVDSFNEVWPSEAAGGGGVSVGPRSPRSPRSPRGSPPRPGPDSVPGALGTSTGGSPRSPSARTLTLAAAESAEAHRLSFVKQHIFDILRIISSDPSDEGASVTLDDIDSLGILISGGQTLEHPAARLSEMVPWPEVSVVAAKAADWLQAALSVNEVLYPPLPPPATVAHHFDRGVVHSPPPSPPRGGESTFSAGSGPSGGGSGGSNSSSPHLLVEAPRQSVEIEADPTNYLPRVVSLVVRHTVMTRDERSTGGLRDLQVRYCQQATLYLIEPYGNATIFGCTDCTVVVGPVRGLLRVVGCERVQVVSACRRLIVSSCVDSVFPVFSASHPILSGDNRACQFAPYNTAYEALAGHLARAGLAPTVNYWFAPLDLNTVVLPAFSPASSPPKPPELEAETDSFSPLALPPDKFLTLTVPTRSSSASLARPPPQNPFPLPLEYAAALRARLDAVQSLQREVLAQGKGQSISADPAARVLVEDAVRAHFADWLVTSGNLRQVVDLLHLDRACLGGGVDP